MSLASSDYYPVEELVVILSILEAREEISSARPQHAPELQFIVLHYSKKEWYKVAVKVKEKTKNVRRTPNNERASHGISLC